MAKANVHDAWEVGPHDPIERLDEGLVTVAGEIRMPLGNFPRRMTVVALSGGRSAIWSAIPLHERAMEQVEALGDPAFLIVPGVAHRLDIKPWKRRYPEMQVLCPPGAREAVEEVIPVDLTDDVLGDPDVQFETVPGVGGKEGALIVHRGEATTLIVNDILAYVHHPHGIGAHIMARLMGFGVKEPQIPWVGKRMFVENEKALAGAFRRWAQLPGLARIVVSHGDVITDRPSEVLETVADGLKG